VSDGAAVEEIGSDALELTGCDMRRLKRDASGVEKLKELAGNRDMNMDCASKSAEPPSADMWA
jgi:hypothetical protein